jgi:starch-binding outer membrane protein, SusD/RagB family
MNLRIHAAILFGLVLLGSCQSDVPDLNNPGLEQLRANPTAPAAEAVATGLLIGTRSYIAPRNGYVSLLGVLGRESYDLDTGDPRFVTELLLNPNLDPGTPAIGGNFWTQPYANIRNANILIDALPKVADLSDADKEASRGFAKTIEALDFLNVINTRDTNGAPIDVDLPFGQLAPIATKDQVFARIAQLLDEAQAHLAAAGAKFPFPLSPGFSGFDTPATFLKFNRALKARVEVYRGNFALALAALQSSFLDTNADLRLGVYHSFSTGSGDTTNGLDDPLIYAHPSIRTDAELKPGGAPDNRLAAKIRTVTAKSLQGVTSDLAFTLYQTADAPVPIIRNEELILLRAEANIGLKTGASLDSAIADINLIRTTSGGLPPRNDLNAANILDELLRQKRYSLLFEGGHRWIDMRRYGKLSALQDPGTVVHSAFPIPLAETDARH